MSQSQKLYKSYDDPNDDSSRAKSFEFRLSNGGKVNDDTNDPSNNEGDKSFKDLTSSYVKAERRNTKFMTNFGLINQSDYSSSIENKSKILGSKKNKMSYVSNEGKPDTTFPELK